MFGKLELADRPLSKFFPDHKSKLEQVYEKHMSQDEDTKKVNDQLRWDRMNSNAQPSADSKMNFIYNELVNVDGGSVSHPELKAELDYRMRTDKVFEEVFPEYVENVRKTEDAERLADKFLLPHFLECYKELKDGYLAACHTPEASGEAKPFIDEYGFKWYNAFVVTCNNMLAGASIPGTIKSMKEACKKY